MTEAMLLLGGRRWREGGGGEKESKKWNVAQSCGRWGHEEEGRAKERKDVKLDEVERKEKNRCHAFKIQKVQMNSMEAFEAKFEKAFDRRYCPI